MRQLQGDNEEPSLVRGGEIVLPFFVLAIGALADRVTKALAIAEPARSTPLIKGVLSFEPGVNARGPLGIVVVDSIFFILAVALVAVLAILIWSETSPVNRALLAGALFGIASNSYDKFRYEHIVDTLRLIGGLSFNLADVLIVIGVVGVIIRYRWPKRQEQSNI